MEELQRALAQRYHLVREIGRGATATVYRARDLRYERQVAIKVLLPEVASTAAAQRFTREILIIAKLTHPHILPLLDSGEALGRPYYVMPFIRASLQQLLDAQQLVPVSEAVDVGREIAQALGYAHAAGVLHRDIKPGNILLSGKHALLADFGASILLTPDSDDQRLTQPGYGVGTPLYVSPEQGAGESNLDARSDIYSLGCLIHEMLTGRPPFVGRTASETIAMRFTKDAEPVRALRQEVPAHVERALLRAMARDPDKRFTTADEFALALSEDTSNPATGTSVSAPSVAVLPFQNLSGDLSNDHFSRGISEEIADALGRVRNLRLVGTTSTIAIDNATDLRAIGRQLNAGALLEGSVRRAGDTVRVSARLVQTSDACLLWSDSYTRKLEDVFAVQAEIAQMVARSLQVQLLGQSFGPVARDTEVSLEAHELYLRGRHAWNKRTEHELQQSVEYLSRAIELEPNFAQAHAGLADSLVTLALYGVREPNQVVPRAKESARKALSIDPTLADAHTTLGCALAIYDWDWPQAENEFQRSMSLNPGYATAPHWYAMQVLAPLARFDEAFDKLRLAVQLDPVTPTVAVSAGSVLYVARRFSESVEWYERVLKSEPGFFPAQHMMGQSLLQLGEHLRAINAFERALDLSGGSIEVTASLAHARAVIGDAAGAEKLLDRLTAAAADRYVSPCLLAQIYVGLGNHDRAFDLLERGLSVHAAEMAWLGVRPAFDELREENRFRAVLGAIGLKSAH